MNHIDTSCIPDHEMGEVITSAGQTWDALCEQLPGLSTTERLDLLKTLLTVSGQRHAVASLSSAIRDGAVTIYHGITSLEGPFSEAGTTIAHGFEALGSSNIQASELVQSAIANVVCAMSQSGPDGDVERGLVYLADAISAGLSGIDDALTRHANKK